MYNPDYIFIAFVLHWKFERHTWIYVVHDVRVKETRPVPRRGWRVHREGPAERSHVPSVRALSHKEGGPKSAAATSNCTVRPFRGKGVNLGAPFKEPTKVDEDRLERALVAAQREVEVQLEEAKILQALRALGWKEAVRGYGSHVVGWHGWWCWRLVRLRRFVTVESKDSSWVRSADASLDFGKRNVDAAALKIYSLWWVFWDFSFSVMASLSPRLSLYGLWIFAKVSVTISRGRV